MYSQYCFGELYLKKDFANLDGFRCYKVKNRGDAAANDRLYIAPVYIIGLPGDVALLNKEMEVDEVKQDFSQGVKVPMTDEQKKLKGECLEDSIYDKERQLKGNEV